MEAQEQDLHRRTMDQACREHSDELVVDRPAPPSPDSPGRQLAGQDHRSVAGAVKCDGRRPRLGRPSRPSRGAAGALRWGGWPASDPSARPHGHAPDRGRPPARAQGPAPGDPPQQGQTGKILGVPRVGLHPLPGGSLEPGRCRNPPTHSAIPASLAARL